MFEDDKQTPKPNSEGKAIGIDLGLTHFCITSDSQKFDNPRWLKKHEQNLKHKQKQLCRKQKGSNNQNKSRLKVAKVHNKITRCREGLRLLTVGYAESNSACRTTVAASGTGATAYRPDVRPSRGGRKKSTTRQSVG